MVLTFSFFSISVFYSTSSFSSVFTQTVLFSFLKQWVKFKSQALGPVAENTVSLDLVLEVITKLHLACDSYQTW